METAKITFKDGTQIEAEVNGSCFIVDSKPNFPDDLSFVTVNTRDEENVLKETEINEAASVDGRYWFSIRELNRQEIEMRKQVKNYEQVRSDVDYIALVADVDLTENGGEQ